MNTEERQAYQERLFNVLLDIEKQTGRKVRLTPRGELDGCPLWNFSPGYDSRKGWFYAAGFTSIWYSGRYERYFYGVGNVKDADTWVELDREERISITRWLETKLRERKTK